MATITTRTGANGKTTYKAQVRIRRAGVIIHQETQTFDRRAAAVTWGRNRESELSKPEALEHAKSGDPSLGKVITQYLEESKREVGRAKRQALTMIAAGDLGQIACSKVTSGELVRFGVGLDRAESTVSAYFSHLRAVFKVAKPAWGYPLQKSAIIDALDVLSELGVVGPGNTRDRRPTVDELSRIVEWMYTRWLSNPKGMAPYHLIILFAVFSARRRSEIVRMRRVDLDPKGCRLLVYDMKDPRKKLGNHVWVDLTYEALRVAQAAPVMHPELVFDIGKTAVSNEFHEACEALGIEDLRFHDLRHEGVSRLFELGKSIPEVGMMSGHKTWTNLKRYAHIHAFGDKYAGWPWLDIIAPLPQRPQS